MMEEADFRDGKIIRTLHFDWFIVSLFFTIHVRWVYSKLFGHTLIIFRFSNVYSSKITNF